MTEENVRQTLRGVKDPELGIDIVTLGLIRKITIDDATETGVPGAEVLMTLTTPFCPFADDLITDVENALEKIGFGNVRVELTFDPPWEPSRELRAQMGL